METANPILGNPLLLAAILLFLAILPRALREKKKTPLDKAVERFEKEELKTAAKKSSAEDSDKSEKPIALRDGSLVYRKKDDADTQQTTDEFGGIPPFRSEEEDERVKIVKPGVPISHFETAEPPPKKKVKLIKQEFSIAPDPNRAPSKKKAISDPLKNKPTKAPVDAPKPAQSEDFPIPPASHKEEANDSWIEAEIPGLTLEPDTEETPKEIPVFNAFPKKKYLPEADKPLEPLAEEKEAVNVKNIASKTEKKKDPKPEKSVPLKADSPKSERKILRSKPKEVEINAPVVSHKNIAKKEEESRKTEVTAIPSQENETGSSPETMKHKPFLLDLKYLDTEELEPENSVSHEKLPADIVEAAIARLNALQVNLENQLVSIPKDNLDDEDMRKERTQNSLPDLWEVTNTSSDKKEVSMEELDSFLFTAIQRKKKE